MAIDVVISVKDQEATSRIKRFASTTEKETQRATGTMRRDFKNLAQDISRDMAGSAGSIVGSIGRVGGSFGLLTAAVLGAGIAFTQLAKNAAESMNDAQGQKFLSLLERIEARVKGIGTSLGEEIVARINGPVGQGLIKLIGLEETAQETMARYLRERKAELDAARAAKFAEIESSLKRSETILQEIRLNKLLKTLEAGMAENRKRFDQEQFEAVQKLREQQIANATLRIDAERDFLQAEIQGIDQIGASIQQMNERLDDSEASAARKKFLAMFEEEGSKSVDITQQITAQFITLTGVLNNLRTSGMSWFDQLLSVGANVFANILTSGVSGGSGGLLKLFGFANGGIIGAQNGLIVRRPTVFIAGENARPEAIVPLSAEKRSQRNAVMQAAGLDGANAGNIVVNINNVQHVDPVTVRNLLLPEINRQIRRGEKLLASQLR